MQGSVFSCDGIFNDHSKITITVDSAICIKQQSIKDEVMKLGGLFFWTTRYMNIQEIMLISMSIYDHQGSNDLDMTLTFIAV